MKPVEIFVHKVQVVVTFVIIITILILISFSAFFFADTLFLKIVIPGSSMYMIYLLGRFTIRTLAETKPKVVATTEKIGFKNHPDAEWMEFGWEMIRSIEFQNIAGNNSRKIIKIEFMNDTTTEVQLNNLNFNWNETETRIKDLKRAFDLENRKKWTPEDHLDFAMRIKQSQKQEDHSRIILVVITVIIGLMAIRLYAEVFGLL